MTRKGVVTAVLAATLFAGGVMASDFVPVCSDWNLDATPTSGEGSDLRSIDALNTSNVWAVGHAWGPAGTRDGAPVAMRWDGSAWTVESLPDLTYLGVEPVLEAVGIAPTGDPWVVGHLRDASLGRNVPLILRWSGGFWEAHRVGLADSFAPRYPLLRDVVAIAAKDAWAVGEARTDVKGAIEPFAAHWDGTAWSEVAMPGTAGGNRVLTAVSAAGPDAVWAVGYDVDPAMKNTSYARIYRWDGSAWSVVDQPAATKAGSALRDIVALAANDIWAVGEIGAEAGLFLHWDGSRWMDHPSPVTADPRSVDGAASSDVWAVGARGTYHWDGTIWSATPSTKPATGARRAITVAGLCAAWSVSSWSDTAGNSSSMVERLGQLPAQDPPPTPLAFAATPKASKQIVLDWLPGGDPTGAVAQTAFVIERCNGDAAACATQFTVIQKVTGKITSYTDSGLKPATFYTYRIYAVNNAGESALTKPSTALTLDETGPSSLPVPGRTRSEPGPRGSEASPFSIPVPPQPSTPPPTPIELIAKPATSKQIALAWASGGGPMGPVGQTAFVIERCIGGAGAACFARFAAIQKVPGNVTSFVDTGLEPATAYTYRIYAVNDSEVSDPTESVTASTFSVGTGGGSAGLPEPNADRTPVGSAPYVRAESPLPPRPAPPATPTGFFAKPATSRQIVLGWASGDPTGAAGQTAFVVERCVGEALACQTRFTTIGKAGGKATSFVDSGLQPATSYTYRMYAINDIGKSELTPPETALTFPPDPSLPRGRTAPGPRP